MSRIVRIFVLLLGLLPTWAVAGSLLQSTGQGARLELSFPRAVSFSQRDKGSNLILQLNQPLVDVDLVKVSKAMKQWVSSLWGGLDAILVRPQPGFDLKVSSKGQRLILSFSKARPKKISGAKADANISKRQQRRLHRLEARWFYDNNQPLLAAAKLRELIEAHPDAVQARLDLAEVEQSLGRWQKALHLYQKALELEPDSRGVVSAKAALLHTHGSFAQVQGYTESFGDTEDKQVVNSTARVLLDEWHAINFRHRLIDLEERVDVRRVDGTTSRFSGQRQHLGLRLDYQTTARGQGHVGITHNGKRFGVTGRHEVLSDLGHSWVEGGLGEAWLELPEAVISYGFRDRLALGHRWSHAGRVFAQGNVAVNNYGLDGVGDAISSWELNLDLRYRFPGLTPDINIGYVLDKERTFSPTELQDSAGRPFLALGLVPSEVHSFDVNWSERLTDYLRVHTQVGYGWDRINASRGIRGSLDLVYEPLPELELGFNTAIDNTSGRAGDSRLNRMGLYIKLRF